MSSAEAAKRVRALLAVARRIADPGDPLGRRARQQLLDTSGLSAAGVALALERHLETGVSEADLTRLLQVTTRAPRCHVLLAANVCTAALRALACAIATAPQVQVRASSRDPVVAELLIEVLCGDPAFDGEVSAVATLNPSAGDEVHLYGSDETLRTVAAGLPKDLRVRARGSGMGVAIVDADVDAEDAAEALARDLVPFDGRGCLSPRIALVAAGEARATAFAEAVDGALSRYGRQVPRGPLSVAERAELQRYRAIYETVGAFYDGSEHAVALDPRPEGLMPAPALRAVLVAACGPDRLPALLEPWATRVSALGMARDGALAAAARALCPQARCSSLGMMQIPPLDGPVDLRQLDR